MPRRIYNFSQFLGESYFIKEEKMNFGKFGDSVKKFGSDMSNWFSNLKKAIKDKIFGVIKSGPKAGTSVIKLYLPEDGDIVSQIKTAYAGTPFASMNSINSEQMKEISESFDYDSEELDLSEGTKSGLSSTEHDEIKGVRDVDTKELFDILEKEFYMIQNGRGQKPVYFIFGAPGIGKTMIIGQIAQKYRVPIIEVDVSLRNIEDLAGVPTPKDVNLEITQEKIKDLESRMSELENENEDNPEIPKIRAQISRLKEMGEGGTRDNPPSWLPKLSEKGGIIFLDEANRPTSESVYNVIAQFFQEKRIGTYNLPAKWMIVAAGNRPAESEFVKNFDHSFTRRIVPLNFVPDPEAWKNYSLQKGYPAELVKIISENPDLFHFLEIGSDVPPMQKYPSPASWEDAFKDLQNTLLWKKKQSWEDLSDQELENIFKDHVGAKTADAFVEFLKFFKSLSSQDINDIFNNPEKARIIGKENYPKGSNKTSFIAGLAGFLIEILKKDHSTPKKFDGKVYYEIDDLQKLGNLLDYLARYDLKEQWVSVYADICRIWPLFSWNSDLNDPMHEIVKDEFEDGSRKEDDPLVQAALLSHKYLKKFSGVATSVKTGDAFGKKDDTASFINKIAKELDIKIPKNQ